MAEKAQASGLQVDEDRHWQERLWTAQRIAWAIMALLVAVAALGLTGKGGPLATASVQLGGASVEYPRITRWQSSDEILVRLPANTTGEVQVELSQPFVELFKNESISPEPSRVDATGRGHRFTFETSGEGGEPRIVFNIKATRAFWSRSLQVRVGNAAADMTMTVLP
jgi:hypothetical protein